MNRVDPALPIRSPQNNAEKMMGSPGSAHLRQGYGGETGALTGESPPGAGTPKSPFIMTASADHLPGGVKTRTITDVHGQAAGNLWRGRRGGLFSSVPVRESPCWGPVPPHPPRLEF